MRNADNFEQGTCLERPNSLGSVIINLNNATNFSTFAFILNSFPVKRTGCFSIFSQKKDRVIRMEVSFTSLKLQGVTQVKK